MVLLAGIAVPHLPVELRENEYLYWAPAYRVVELPEQSARTPTEWQVSIDGRFTFGVFVL